VRSPIRLFVLCGLSLAWVACGSGSNNGGSPDGGNDSGNPFDTGSGHDGPGGGDTGQVGPDGQAPDVRSDSPGMDSHTGTETGGDSGTMFPAGTICNTSGTPRTAPSTVAHVLVFLFENENFGSVNGNANAPYMSSIATQCAYASNYNDSCFTDNLVSLPHYLALTSGSNCNTGNDSGGSGCIRDDSDPTSHTLSTTSIFQQVSSWKSYEESMPSACAMSSSTPYACKHNPAVYYTALGSSCSANDIPIAALTCDPSNTMTSCGTPSNAFTQDLANDTLPAFAFVTPNLDNDMHDGTVTQGDNWFYTYFPLVLASKAYLSGQLAVYVLWDEQGSFSKGATPNFFVSPYITSGKVASTVVNHFSALRAIENHLGITTYLGCASGTPPGGTGSCPAESTNDLRGAIGF
jgi:hypothetical protein